MKKYIIGVVLSILATIVAAELPAKMTVYSPGTTGPLSICRAIFTEYDKVYNTNSMFVIKPGASGMIAMLEMTKDKNFSILCASGLSESVANISIFPGHEDAHKLLTMVNIFAESPTVFSTRTNSTYNTLIDLIQSNKQINVGYHSNILKLSAELALSKVQVNWIPFKSSMDAVPSLLDGSVDLYADGGSLTALINSGKLKSLGHLNGIEETPGLDLTKLLTEAAKIHVILAISTSSNNNLDDIDELNKRVNKILIDEKVISTIKQISNKPVIKTVKEANLYVEYFRKEYSKKYNVKQ